MKKDLPKLHTFADKVRDVVRSIPRGSVMTYGQVARRAGNPRAARAVGTVMAGNFDPTVPCHRVVRSDGYIGAYNRGGPEKKRVILTKEGVQISKGGIVSLDSIK